MKLSEAIRLGAMLHPQRFGSMTSYRDRRGRFCGWLTTGARVASTCALGAATQAGYRDTEDERTAPRYPCPACGLSPWSSRPVISMVVHLNDHHRWTREQIADWVGTIEGVREDVRTAVIDDAGSHLTVGVD